MDESLIIPIKVAAVAVEAVEEDEAVVAAYMLPMWC